jgi:hypothetical protein
VGGPFPIALAQLTSQTVAGKSEMLNAYIQKTAFPMGDGPESSTKTGENIVDKVTGITIDIQGQTILKQMIILPDGKL